MGRRSKYDFFFNDLTGRTPAAPEHVCDKEGCNKPAEYRAPKDRTLSEYYWFCLEHVQEYNAQWDYYAGMSPDEIEEHLKQDVCWQRPTWKLGERGLDPSMFADPLNIKAEAFHFEEGREKAFKSDKPQPLDPAVIVAAKILEVDFPLQQEEVRLNYKRLAKKYHPDSHGGSKELEERFKDITEAYRLIMSILDTDKE